MVILLRILIHHSSSVLGLAFIDTYVCIFNNIPNILSSLELRITTMAQWRWRVCSNMNGWQCKWIYEVEFIIITKFASFRHYNSMVRFVVTRTWQLGLCCVLILLSKKPFPSKSHQFEWITVRSMHHSTISSTFQGSNTFRNPYTFSFLFTWFTPLHCISISRESTLHTIRFSIISF